MAFFNMGQYQRSAPNRQQTPTGPPRPPVQGPSWAQGGAQNDDVTKPPMPPQAAAAPPVAGSTGNATAPAIVGPSIPSTSSGSQMGTATTSQPTPGNAGGSLAPPQQNPSSSGNGSGLLGLLMSRATGAAPGMATTGMGLPGGGVMGATGGAPNMSAIQSLLQRIRMGGQMNTPGVNPTVPQPSATPGQPVGV